MQNEYALLEEIMILRMVFEARDEQFGCGSAQLQLHIIFKAP